MEIGTFVYSKNQERYKSGILLEVRNNHAFVKLEEYKK